MRKTIRWAVWGAGAIANKVISDLHLVESATLHAAGARNIERARSFAQQHGAARSYDSLPAMLQDAAIDIVYVATPHHLHMQDCIACIEAGKAVLCEKPFTLNATQAQRVVDAARRHKVFCMEAMWTRFIPAVKEVKRLVDSGAIGRVRLMQGTFAFAATPNPASRLFDPVMGGGALLDIGIYPVSFAHHMLGAPEMVRGLATIGDTGVDVQSTYQLHYSGGALADLSASLLVPGHNEFILYGETGTLRLCKPFYSAHRFVLEQHALPVAHHAALANPAGLRKLLASPAARSLRRRLSSLAAAWPSGRSHTLPFPGYGYQFELTEVCRCLREQRTESDTMPLQHTLEVMRMMDELRSQWGLVYPQE